MVLVLYKVIVHICLEVNMNAFFGSDIYDNISWNHKMFTYEIVFLRLGILIQCLLIQNMLKYSKIV